MFYELSLFNLIREYIMQDDSKQEIKGAEYKTDPELFKYVEETYPKGYVTYIHEESEALKKQRAAAYKKQRAEADDRKSDAFKLIKDTGILVIGVPGNYRPFADLISEKEDGEIILWGLDVEIALTLGKHMSTQLKKKISVRFVQTSWGALTSDTQAGYFDIAMGGIQLTDNREKENELTYSYLTLGKTPLISSENVKFGKNGVITKIKKPFSSYQEMLDDDVIFCVNPGGMNEEFIAKHLGLPILPKKLSADASGEEKKKWEKANKDWVSDFKKADNKKRLILIADNNDCHFAVGQEKVLRDKLHPLFLQTNPKIEKDDHVVVHVMITDNVECMWKAKIKGEAWSIHALNPNDLIPGTTGDVGYMLKQGDEKFREYLNTWIDQNKKLFEERQQNHHILA